MKTILTYGTFDLFHLGHLNMLERLRGMGDRLIVGVSTDEFNLLKGKRSVFSYAERSRIVAALRCVDLIFPEDSWQQKSQDISKYAVDVFGIGADWRGKFTDLESLCDVVYLERTPSISTTDVKQSLAKLDEKQIQLIKESLDSVMSIMQAIE